MLRFFQYIFLPANTIAIFINFIILGISAAIGFWLFKKYVELVSAEKKIESIKQEFAKSQAGTRQNKLVTRESIKRLIHQDKFRHTWFLKKIFVIEMTVQDPSTVNTILDQVDSEIEWNTFGRLKYPISSLIIFGLLGTIWGLQEAIYSLKPTLSGALDFEQLKLVMSETLSGMQTAFSTTLAGLFTSIILGFIMSYWLRNRLTKVLLKQNEIIIQHVLPVYSSLGESHISNLTDRTEELKKAISDLAREGQNIFQPIVEAVNATREGTEKIYQASHNFLKTNENISEMSESMAQTFKALSDKLSSVEIAINSYNSLQHDIQGLFDKVTQMPDSIEEMVTRIGNGLEKKQDTLIGQGQEKVAAQIEKVDESVIGLSKTISDFKLDSETKKDEMFEEIDAVIKKLADTSQKIGENNEKADHKYKTTLEQIDDLLVKYEKMRNSAVDSHNSNLKVLRDQVQQYVHKMDENQNSRNEQVLKIMNDWANYNKYLGESLVEFKKMPDKLKSVIKSNGKNN